MTLTPQEIRDAKIEFDREAKCELRRELTASTIKTVSSCLSILADVMEGMPSERDYPLTRKGVISAEAFKNEGFNDCRQKIMDIINGEKK